MALDGSLFNLPDTEANEQAFGRSSNQYGKGAYPQARAVFLTECGSHATIGLHVGRYDEAELHGAARTACSGSMRTATSTPLRRRYRATSTACRWRRCVASATHAW